MVQAITVAIVVLVAFGVSLIPALVASARHVARPFSIRALGWFSLVLVVASMARGLVGQDPTLGWVALAGAAVCWIVALILAIVGATELVAAGAGTSKGRKA